MSSVSSAALGFCSALLPSGESSALFTSRFPHPRFSISLYGRVRAFTAAPLVHCTGSTKPAEGAPETKTTRQPRGITKPKPISPVLQELLGVAEIPRTQALKQIWAYIKQHDLQVTTFRYDKNRCFFTDLVVSRSQISSFFLLQDPADRKVIVCDDMLKKIFGGRERVGFLQISGLMNVHFIKWLHVFLSVSF